MFQRVISYLGNHKRATLLWILIIFFLFSVASLSYWKIMKNQRGQADTEPLDLNTVLQSRVGVFAGACSDPIECEGVTDSRWLYFEANPITVISSYAGYIIKDEIFNCVSSMGQNYTPNNLPADGHIQIGNCDMILKKEDGSDTYRAQIKISGAGSPDGTFISTYDLKAKNKGQEKIDIAWQATGNYVYFIFFNNDNLQWRVKDDDTISTVNFNGSVKAPFEFSMDNDEFLEDYFDLWNDGNSDLQIDIANSSWRAFSSGRVFGSIEGSWNFDDSPPEKDDVKITNLEFCPDDPKTAVNEGCQIRLEEKLDLKAEKLGKTDNIKGKIALYDYRKADYFGNGHWDTKTNQLVWTNLTLKDEDERLKSQNLSFGGYSWANYSSNQKSKGEKDGVTKKYQARTEDKKDIVYAHAMMGQGMMKGGQIGPGQVTGEAHINVIEDNVDGLITRSGTGSKFNGSWIKGIYDNQEVLMKITDPAAQAGQRIDPFTGVPSQFTQDYFPPGTIHAPGEFKASEYNGVTTIASRKVKSVPEIIYVFRSYNLPDSNFTPQVLDKVDRLLGALDKAGADIRQFITNDKQSMLNAFNQVTNGSWVINIGHGAPMGLAAGNDLVTDQEIQAVLRGHQVQIDTFAGLTCYAGRRTSLAQKVIGSLGVSSGEEFPTMLKLVGLGNQSWTLNTEDIFQEILSSAGCSSGNIHLR